MQILKNKNLPKGITIRKAAKLLKISRSTLYYKPRKESSCNQELMELIEKNYLKDPTMGFRRMKARLERLTGKRINHKRVRRLMRKMGLKGIVPSPRTTKTTKTHWVRYYNSDRPHQALGYKTPDEVYYGYRVAV